MEAWVGLAQVGAPITLSPTGKQARELSRNAELTKAQNPQDKAHKSTGNLRVKHK